MKRIHWTHSLVLGKSIGIGFQISLYPTFLLLISIPLVQAVLSFPIAALLHDVYAKIRAKEKIGTIWIYRTNTGRRVQIVGINGVYHPQVSYELEDLGNGVFRSIDVVSANVLHNFYVKQE